MPPHVTLLYPFIEADRLSPKIVDSIARVVERFDAFECDFVGISRFPAKGAQPAVLYLRPEPEERFREMTAALSVAFPEYPLYGGAHVDVVPHLTVAADGRAPLASISAQLTTCLPINISVSEVWLMELTAEGWTTVEGFRLTAAASDAPSDLN
jgi:2'-5' RNA ligase